MNLSDRPEIAAYLEKFPAHEKFAEWILVPPSGDEVAEDFPEILGSSLLQNEFGCIMKGVTRLAFYVCLRLQGEGHRMAEQLAAQQAARGMTDDVFFAGMGMLGDQMRPAQLDSLLKVAKSQGFTPSATHVYMPGLARFRGDREAFVSRSDGRSYIKRILEDRGWECEGGVNTTARAPETDPLDKSIPLADDIIAQTARDMVEANPEVAKIPRRELRERIVEKHGFTVGK
jgi:hypothetical protein